MTIQVERVQYHEVEAMRDLYRQEANCQIIGDSLLVRGLADPYLIVVDGRRAGYGGIRTKYDPGRLMEFYTLPHVRSLALPLFRELLAVGQATEMEAQTNIPWMLTLLYDCAIDITATSILFEDARFTQLTCLHGVFRHATLQDVPAMFAHHSEPVGEWVVEAQESVIATGGFLCHYNPPYGDLFMEVVEPSRQQGGGSYLVQEIKRVCYETGKKPGARCHVNNVASRRTLEKAGFLPCARMLVGKVRARSQSS